jgi:hypothetical protein
MGQIETFTEVDLTLHELTLATDAWVVRRAAAERDDNMNADLNGRRDMQMLRLNHLLEQYFELAGPFEVE